MRDELRSSTALVAVIVRTRVGIIRPGALGRIIPTPSDSPTRVSRVRVDHTELMRSSVDRLRIVRWGDRPYAGVMTLR